MKRAIVLPLLFIVLLSTAFSRPAETETTEEQIETTTEDKPAASLSCICHKNLAFVCGKRGDEMKTFANLCRLRCAKGFVLESSGLCPSDHQN